jgi:hypothetical protein
MYGDPTGNYVHVFESHNGRSAVSLSKKKRRSFEKYQLRHVGHLYQTELIFEISA